MGPYNTRMDKSADGTRESSCSSCSPANNTSILLDPKAAIAGRQVKYRCDLPENKTRWWQTSPGGGARDSAAGFPPLPGIASYRSPKADRVVTPHHAQNVVGLPCTGIGIEQIDCPGINPCREEQSKFNQPEMQQAPTGACKKIIQIRSISHIRHP